jgi:hypothetical protein
MKEVGGGGGGGGQTCRALFTYVHNVGRLREKGKHTPLKNRKLYIFSLYISFRTSTKNRKFLKGSGANFHYIWEILANDYRARICTPFKEPRNRFPAWQDRFLKGLQIRVPIPAIEEKPAKIQTSNRLASSLVRVLTQLPLMQRLKNQSYKILYNILFWRERDSDVFVFVFLCPKIISAN